MTTVTDRTLFERWIALRDAEAFNEIISRHADMVFGVCRRVVRNDADAEDVAQDCFLKLARTGSVPRSSVLGWLHAVATRCAVDFLRARSRREARERASALARAAEGAAEPTLEEVEAQVDECIAQLPPELRDVIVAHFLERRTQEAVAVALGVSRQTVSHRMRKGIERLRLLLVKRGVGISGAALASTLGSSLVEAAPGALLASLGRIALAGPSIAAGPAVTLSLVANVGGILVAKKLLISVLVAAALLLLSGIAAIKSLSDPAHRLASNAGGSPAAVEEALAADAGDAIAHPAAERRTEVAEADAASVRSSPESSGEGSSSLTPHDILLLLNHESRPVTGVNVDWYLPPALQAQFSLDACEDLGRSETSDAAGQVVGRDLPRDVRLLAVVWHDNYATRWISPLYSGDRREISLELPYELRGSVLDENGQILPRSTVTLQGDNYRDTLDARTGRFAFAGLSRGPWTIRANNYSSNYQQTDMRGIRLSSPPKEVLLKLSRGHALLGVAVDKATKSPLPGIVVEAWEEERGDDHAMQRAVTDALGRFQFQGLGQWVVLLFHGSGYAGNYGVSPTSTEREFALEKAELRAQFFNEKKEELAGARIEYLCNNAPLRSTTLDEDGWADLYLTNGLPNQVVYFYGRVEDWVGVGLVSCSRQCPIGEVTLQPPATLFGMVRDGRESHHLKGARLELQTPLGDTFLACRSDENGAYRFRGVPLLLRDQCHPAALGALRLVCRLETSQPFVANDIQLSPGESICRDIILEKGHDLLLELRDSATKEPLSGLGCFLEANGQSGDSSFVRFQHEGRTDAKGQLLVPGISFQRYVLSVSAKSPDYYCEDKFHIQVEDEAALDPRVLYVTRFRHEAFYRRVVGPNTLPLAGIPFVVGFLRESADPSQAKLSDWEIDQEGITNEAGLVVIEDLPSGQAESGERKRLLLLNSPELRGVDASLTQRILPVDWQARKVASVMLLGKKS